MNGILNIFKKKNYESELLSDNIRYGASTALLSFLIPTLTMALIYITMLIYPFGDGTVLVLDLNGQYVYFFEALRDALVGKGSIFYSFERALSGEFLGIFAYYLASPLSFIVALFPKHMIQEALFTIIIMKCGLCGLTSHYYLTKTRKKLSPIAALIFSTSYALCSYVIIYGSNTMWIDALYLLPLIMLGAERLIREKRYMLYTVSLAVALVSNYYIGYMLCIFSALYFFVCYFSFSKEEVNLTCEKYHFVKSGLRYAFFSAISALMASPMILSAYYSLSFGKSEFSQPSYEFLQKTSFFDIFVKMLPGSYDTVRPEGAPVLYCSMLCLILAILYFISPQIGARKKLAYGALLVILAASFGATTLDLVWHGFQFPNWLNFRYSFIFSFIIVVIAADTFVKLKEIPGKDIAKVVIGVLLLCAIFQKLGHDKIKLLECVWMSLGAALLCLTAIYIFKSGKSVGVVALLTITLVELFVNGVLSEQSLNQDVGFSKHSSYSDFMARYRAAADYMKELDSGLYRSENYNIKKVNDNYAIGLNGVSGSTSTLNKKVIDFLSDMGYSSRSHHSNYYGGNPVGDSLLGIKYLLSTPSRGADPYYTTVAIDNTTNTVLYQNPYALSIAYTVNPDFEKFDTSACSNPFELLNRMCGEMLGEGRLAIFEPLECDTKLENVSHTNVSSMRKYKRENKSSARIIFTVKAQKDSAIYAYFPVKNGYRRDVTVKFGGREVKKYFTSDKHDILCLGTFKKGESAYLTMTLDADDLYFAQTNYFFTVNEEKLDYAMNNLARGNAVINQDYSDDNFKGTVSVDGARNLFMLTMPYDKNIEVKIDGKKQETFEVAGIFTGVMVGNGTHEFEVTYVPHEFLRGAVYLFVGVALTVLYTGAGHLLKRRRARLLVLEANTLTDGADTSMEAENSKEDT